MKVVYQNLLFGSVSSYDLYKIALYETIVHCLQESLKFKMVSRKVDKYTEIKFKYVFI